VNHWLDRLARTLAGNQSRRRTLLQLGGLVGATVVATLPGPVLAQGNQERDRDALEDCCHDFCEQQQERADEQGDEDFDREECFDRCVDRRQCGTD